MSITVSREIAEAEDWYQTHRVVEMYRKMKKMMEQDMNFDDVQETFFMQNMDNGKFKTNIHATRELGSHGVADTGANTEMVFDIEYFSRTPISDSDQGYFGTMELNVTAELQVTMPGRDSWLHSMLRRLWFNAIYRKQFRYWVEYVEEELIRYINIVRKFFGLEPTVGKSRRLHFEPLEHAI
ncbi:MAG: hypothetical protein SVU32_08085 [Candidatus Nanohaloarchaea archaeon]|nr:hypothetical protein [Candidatus Nanohaloarchaea archaeon]